MKAKDIPNLQYFKRKPILFPRVESVTTDPKITVTEKHFCLSKCSKLNKDDETTISSNEAIATTQTRATDTLK